MSRWILALILCVSAFVAGCAEGLFWKAGHYSPWAREKWESEDQQVDTLFARKRQLNELVERAQQAPAAERDKAAMQLKEIVHRDPIILVRLHAVGLLPEIPSTESIEALKLASRDPDSRVRKAAIDAWSKIQGPVSIAQLQEFIGSDTDVDVRLHATKALGTFDDPSAANALSLALTDTNPAIQFRATESLEKVTGEKIGADVAAWQNYLDDQNRQSTASLDSTIR